MLSIEKVIGIFKSDDKRNVSLRNNILLSGLFKMIGLFTSLLIVPVTLGYLDNEVYGIWMTITSIMYMISTFDIGLGNGLRNYLTEAISSGDYQKARAYLSTSLIALSSIALVLAIASIVPFTLLNFNEVFNSWQMSSNELRNTVIVAVAFTLVNFVIKNIGYIFVALQHYALNDFLTISGNVLSLIIIFFLTKLTTPHLIYVVLAITASPVAIYSIAAIPIFRRYKQLRPSFSSFNRNILKEVVSKSLGFFIIQITSCMIIFGAINIFIARYCGPSEVTTYNIAYKYFNLLAIAYTIIISPMWNAYTDAYVKGDFAWIKGTYNKAILFWILSLAAGLVMLIVSQIFFHLWVGDKVKVPFALSCSVLFYISMFNFNNCVTYLLNGLNKIKVQIITSCTATAVYLLAVFLLEPGCGIYGIVLTAGFTYLIMSLIHFYQGRKLISQTASGIWNK
jgi:O-antigen/teichoic acid export membrane protein